SSSVSLRPSAMCRIKSVRAAASAALTGSSNGMFIRFLQIDLFQVLSERATEVVTLQCELDGGFQETELITCVVPSAFELQTVDRPIAQQVFQRIGQLNLAAGAGLDRFDGGKDFRSKNVASDNSEIGRRFRRFGFLHQIVDAIQSVAHSVV